jgi:uncharacterized repeat protein (TIGR02543 family)
MVTFQFSSHIETNDKATWYVSRDIEGNNVIQSKTIELNLGHPTESNYAFIHVSNNNDQKTYPILIHRNFMYTVEFYNQYSNTVIKYKKIEENTLLSQEDYPSIPTNPPKGYRFTGWSRGPCIVTMDMRIILKAEAKSYIVRLNPNGGKIDGRTGVYSINVTYGASYSLPIPTDEGGSTFTGWYTTKSTSSGVKFQNTGVWETDNDALTLYARWE